MPPNPDIHPTSTFLKTRQWNATTPTMDHKNKWESVKLPTLEEIMSKSTFLVTRPSRLAPKKCINKSIWLATIATMSTRRNLGTIATMRSLTYYVSSVSSPKTLQKCFVAT
jgi:hypothetical protein